MSSLRLHAPELKTDPDICPACNGTGRAIGEDHGTCWECDGAGTVRLREPAEPKPATMYLATSGESVLDFGGNAEELVNGLLRAFDLDRQDVVIWLDVEGEEAPRVAALLRAGRTTWL